MLARMAPQPAMVPQPAMALQAMALGGTHPNGHAHAMGAASGAATGAVLSGQLPGTAHAVPVNGPLGHAGAQLGAMPVNGPLGQQLAHGAYHYPMMYALPNMQVPNSALWLPPPQAWHSPAPPAAGAVLGTLAATCGPEALASCWAPAGAVYGHGSAYGNVGSGAAAAACGWVGYVPPPMPPPASGYVAAAPQHTGMAMAAHHGAHPPMAAQHLQQPYEFHRDARMGGGAAAGATHAAMATPQMQAGHRQWQSPGMAGQPVCMPTANMGEGYCA